MLTRVVSQLKKTIENSGRVVGQHRVAFFFNNVVSVKFTL